MQVTGGRNGYGAKLANIFSTEFVVETCDGTRQKRYRQVWNHPKKRHDVKIVPYTQPPLCDHAAWMFNPFRSDALHFRV